MKLGRNDPCHCGSGKKYKQCCLGKEEEAHRHDLQTQQKWARNLFAANPREAWYDDWSSEEPGEAGAIDIEEDGIEEDWEDETLSEDDDWDDEPEELNSEIATDANDEAAEELWNDFAGRDLNGKISLFEKMLEAPDANNHWEAGEMLHIIFEEALEAEAREQYDSLVEKVRRMAPQIYEFDAPLYVANRITNALALSRGEILPSLVAEHATLAAQEPMVFMTMLTQLRYYGHADLLHTALQRAWPAIKSYDELDEWLPEPPAPLAVRALVFEHLERRTSEAVLLQALEQFSKIPRARIENFIALLSGKHQHSWQASDFEIKQREHRHAYERETTGSSLLKNSVGQNVFNLTLQFQGYLHREHHMPYLKSDVGCGELVSYIFLRAYGDAYPPANVFSKPGELTRQFEFCHPEWPFHERLLCPDRVTMDYYCADLLFMDKAGAYKTAALFALLPMWLDFLVAQQMLEPAHSYRTLLDFFETYEEVHGALRSFKRDPNLYKSLIGWPWRQTRANQA